MNTYNTRGQVHSYDAKTGDGTVKVQEKLYYFYQPKADLKSGDKVSLELIEVDGNEQPENLKKLN